MAGQTPRALDCVQVVFPRRVAVYNWFGVNVRIAEATLLPAYAPPRRELTVGRGVWLIVAIPDHDPHCKYKIG